ncbi:MAG: hypothetical protein LBR19_05830, partial [Bifidobacteriaceae bacterium]|nr:hypothetical protein [Bifidobacteriaceae bacterium]
MLAQAYVVSVGPCPAVATPPGEPAWPIIELTPAGDDPMLVELAGRLAADPNEGQSPATKVLVAPHPRALPILRLFAELIPGIVAVAGLEPGRRLLRELAAGRDPAQLVFPPLLPPLTGPDGNDT